MREAYTVAEPCFAHELYFVEESQFVDEDLCATVDTGCQRTAVGSSTLARLLKKHPEELGVVFRPEQHNFRSVNGISSASRVACVPTSLGKQGSILRPAVFEEGQTKEAPFLLSHPFLLQCKAVLHLDPAAGLSLHLRKFDCTVPLHLGPTGALRVPLNQLSQGMMTKLRRAMQELGKTQAKKFTACCRIGPRP